MKISAAVAPGKMIISGEHAVVYGKPALTMAVNSFAKTVIQEQPAPAVSFALENFNLHTVISLEKLKSTKELLLHKYQAFLQHECSIRDVFTDPLHLAQFALNHTLDYLELPLTCGLAISIHSNIPIGCGMGSSAAISLSIIRAVTHHFGVNLNHDEYYTLRYEVDQLQHCRSSGADVYTSLQGGAVYFQTELREPRTLPSVNFYLVNTGKPTSTTGECVSQVAAHFSADQVLWQDFAQLTEMIDHDLKNNIQENLYNNIRENHKLLVHIGVVPEKVQYFIAELEQQQAAGKICGAGAIAGDAGGIVMVLTESREQLVTLCDRYHFTLLDFQGEANGLHAL